MAANLNDYNKAKKVTEAMFELASNYLMSDDAAEKACAKIISKAALDLPDYSKVALYNILTKEG